MLRGPLEAHLKAVPDFARLLLAATARGGYSPGSARGGFAGGEARKRRYS